MLKINAGCGQKRFHKKGWVNVDINPDCHPDVVLDLSDESWPMWKDSSADRIRADNLLEHLDWPGLLHFMNEAHRVLKPGGLLWIRVPNAELWMSGAFGDPTHRRFFVDKSFQYWDESCQTYQNYGASYGFKPWKLHSILDETEVDATGVIRSAFFVREYSPGEK